MTDKVLGGSDAEAEAEWHNRVFCLEQIISNLKRDKAELIDENERLKETIRELHKDLGFELRDPNGTIWQECERLQKENERLKGRLRILDLGDIEIADGLDERTTPSNSDYVKCKEAYIDGYESGHNDTVESCYGSAEELADDWISEHFAE